MAAPKHFLFDPNSHRKILIETDMVMGRHAGCDIRLRDPSVSGKHCQIQIDKKNEIWLVDLGSTNSTYVNGKPLPSGASVKLAPWDSIRIGTQQFLFNCLGYNGRQSIRLNDENFEQANSLIIEMEESRIYKYQREQELKTELKTELAAKTRAYQEAEANIESSISQLKTIKSKAVKQHADDLIDYLEELMNCRKSLFDLEKEIKRKITALKHAEDSSSKE